MSHNNGTQRRRAIDMFLEALDTNEVVIDLDRDLRVTPDVVDLEALADGRPTAKGITVRLSDRWAVLSRPSDAEVTP